MRSIDILFSQLCKTKNMFKQVQGNARVMILMEPMWAIPFGLFSAYATLYMRGLGLSAPEVGLVLSIGSASNMIVSLAGGHFTDRLGRKKASLIFDLLGWSLPVLIWAFARNFWYFTAAALINGFGAVVYSSWLCLFVEDTPPENRLPIFSSLQIVGLFAGFFVPIAGILVARAGVVSATRWLYLFAFISMTTMFFLRNQFIHESRVGVERMALTQGHSLLESLHDYQRAVWLLLKNRVAMVIFGINLVFSFRDALAGSMTQIYLVEKLAIRPSLIAIFPAISSWVQLGVLLLIIPNLGGRGEMRSLTSGLWLSMAGALAFVLAPPGRFEIIALSTVLGAAGVAFLFPAINAGWNNSLGDQERAKVMAVSFVLLNLVRMGGTAAAGFLYAAAAALPFVISLGLAVLSLFFLVTFRGRPTVGAARIRSDRESGSES